MSPLPGCPIVLLPLVGFRTTMISVAVYHHQKGTSVWKIMVDLKAKLHLSTCLAKKDPSVRASVPRRFCCGVIDIRSEVVLGARYSMCSGLKITHQRSPLDPKLKIEVMSWTSREQNRILEQKMPVQEDVCELFCLRKKTHSFPWLSIQILRIARRIYADFVAMESEVFETTGWTLKISP